MKIIAALFFSSLFLSFSCFVSNGMIHQKSKLNVDETWQKLVNILASKNIQIFADINLAE